MAGLMAVMERWVQAVATKDLIENNLADGMEDSVCRIDSVVGTIDLRSAALHLRFCNNKLAVAILVHR